MITPLRAASLVLGPALLAASGFFWLDGRYGLIGGTLVAWGSLAWLYGLLGVWEHLQPRLPRASAVGIVATLLGAFGGIAFGLQGVFEELFDVSGPQSLAAAAAHPVVSWAVLWGPGPMFPISLVLLGVALLRTGVTPRPLAVLLILGGAAFPLSRAGRIELVAHTIDAALLATSVWLAVLVYGGRLVAGSTSSAVSGTRRRSAPPTPHTSSPGGR
jgi:Domain of unknown function (DUF4386)